MRGENMGTTLKNRRSLAAILIVIVAVSITGLSSYVLMNMGQSSQQKYLLNLSLFQIGQSRIVSGAPNIDEILCGLGLVDNIVGCTVQSDYPPALMQRVALKQVDNRLDWWRPSIEIVLSLIPSTVLLDEGQPNQRAMYYTLLILMISQGLLACIPYKVPQGNTISQIEASIFQVANIFGRTSEAQTIVNKMETKINTIRETVSHQTVLNVLVCVWIDFKQKQVYTCGNSTFLSEIVQKAGGLNVFYDNPLPWPEVTFAEVQAKNPDIILILDHRADLDPSETYTNILLDTNLRNTNAARNDEIYFVQGQAENLFTRPGPRVAEGVELLAKMLFPDLFGKNFDGPPYVLNTGNYKRYLDSFILE
jgi:iron complex transport system substrate-binding protein